MSNDQRIKRTPVKGFTLIELIIVIVILSVLAATAAPKYIDFSSDAKASVMQGVAGSMRSGMHLVHSKAIIQNQLGATGTIQLSPASPPLDVEFGYPTLHYNGGLDNQITKLQQWMDIEIYSGKKVRKNKDDYPNDAFVLAQTKLILDEEHGSLRKDGLQIFFAEAVKDDVGSLHKCVVQFVNATADEPAKISVFVDDC